MLRKALSCFLFFVFIIPSGFGFVSTLDAHSHELCSEVGIHKHETHIECSICSFNNINESTFIFYCYYVFKTKTVDTQPKIIDEIVYLSSRFEISFRKRPPPSYIVLA